MGDNMDDNMGDNIDDGLLTFHAQLREANHALYFSYFYISNAITLSTDLKQTSACTMLCHICNVN